MSDEMFDVVNERDEVIGCRSRSEVHRLGLRHRAVHVLVFNGQGAVFLQKRSRSKDTFPGAWDSSAAGHLAVGESYDAAAWRELQEELGWVPTSAPERRIRLVACPETGQEFVWVYCCRGNGPFCLHPEEIECGDWFPRDVVTRWVRERPGDFASSFLLVWRELERVGGE